MIGQDELKHFSPSSAANFFISSHTRLFIFPLQPCIFTPDSLCQLPLFLWQIPVHHVKITSPWKPSLLFHFYSLDSLNIPNHSKQWCKRMFHNCIMDNAFIRPHAFIHPSTRHLHPYIRYCNCSPVFSSKSWGSQWILGISLLLACRTGSSWSEWVLGHF